MTAPHTEHFLNARRLTLEAVEEMEWGAAELLKANMLASLSVLRALRWDHEQAAAGIARVIGATSGEGQADG
jgi:hypothetical protein